MLASSIFSCSFCRSLPFGSSYSTSPPPSSSLVYNKPWLIAAGERDYDRGGKELHEKLGIPVTKVKFVEMFQETWAWHQTLTIQHLVGGLLCVPAIVPGFCGLDPSVAASLACLGILSEIGWEIEDILTWIYKHFATPNGKDKVPNVMLIMLSIHHSLTTLLGLPMILHYRDLKILHWLCFDLQAAAAISAMVTEYTKLLDMTNPQQLRQFQFLTFLCLVVMIVTRGFHWLYLSGKFMIIWYQEERWIFLLVGTPVILVFSLLINWVVCIESYYKRFVKFMKVSAEYKKLAPDAPAKDRRASLQSLEAAAAEVVVRQSLDEEFVASFFPSRKVDRRVTMPPSLASRGHGKNRSSSMTMLRSSLSSMKRYRTFCYSLTQSRTMNGRERDSSCVNIVFADTWQVRTLTCSQIQDNSKA